MTRSASRALRSLASAALVAAAAFYLWHNSGDLAALGRIGIAELFMLTLAVAAVFIASGWTFRLTVSLLGVHLRPSEWIGLTLVSSAVNYAGPGHLGALAKATFLKRRSKLAYSHFSALIAANGLLFVFFTSLLGLVLLPALRPPPRATLFLAALCLALMALTITTAFLPLPRFGRPGRLYEILNQAMQGFETMRSHPTSILGIGLSILLQHAASSLSSLAAFAALDFEIDPTTAMAIAVFVSLANLVSITPGNLGLQEMVVAYIYSLSGLGFQDGILAAGLIRAIHVAITFSAAPIAAHRLLDKAASDFHPEIPSNREDG